LDRTGLELTEDEAEAVRDYIQERYREEVVNFIEEYGYYPTRLDREMIIDSIYDELTELFTESEYLGAEGGSLGDLEEYSDLEKFLFDLGYAWYYTVYYQQNGEQKNGE
jgi:hypothetical protein